MTLEDMLVEGVTIYGHTSAKMVDGELVKVDQHSDYHFPLDFLLKDRPVSVMWNSEEDELVILDMRHGELQQAGLLEALEA